MQQNIAPIYETLLNHKKKRVVAFDINELSPMLDASGASTACTCKVLREMLLAVSK